MGANRACYTSGFIVWVLCSLVVALEASAKAGEWTGAFTDRRVRVPVAVRYCRGRTGTIQLCWCLFWIEGIKRSKLTATWKLGCLTARLISIQVCCDISTFYLFEENTFCFWRTSRIVKQKKWPSLGRNRSHAWVFEPLSLTFPFFNSLKRKYLLAVEISGLWGNGFFFFIHMQSHLLVS